MRIGDDSHPGQRLRGRGAMQRAILRAFPRSLQASVRRTGWRLTAARAGGWGRRFEPRVTWIFGSPRSGSTWLLQLLGEHPAVVPVNEPLIGLYLGPMLCDLPGFDPEGLDSANFTLRQARDRHPSQFFAAQFTDVWRPSLASMIRKRLLAYAARYPAEVPLSRSAVVVKEPNGSQSADMIMAALPRARLLFLLRDGRDVVDSELAANAPGSWVTSEFPGARGIREQDRLDFVAYSAHKWLWRTEVVEAAFRGHGGPTHLVRYEDLLLDPIRELGAIVDWLGLTASEQELAGWVRQRSLQKVASDLRGPSGFFRAARPGSWRHNLTPEEQATVARILTPKLRELGYED
jgi:hypothetical protein